jgi:type IV pilus assembly protein PilQ
VIQTKEIYRIGMSIGGAVLVLSAQPIWAKPTTANKPGNNTRIAQTRTFEAPPNTQIPQLPNTQQGYPTPSNLPPGVPNQEINIQGNPAPASGIVQPTAPAPPYLPRAVPPPLGDISVSNIDASASYIDLGTAVRVPRLVLKDAPAREVLELLARSAGFNIAFYSGGAGTDPNTGQPGVGGQSGGPPISLNIEDESVQDVFNYVLQLSGLQANRVGRTIFVGSQLPPGARNIISRSLRMNQVPIGQAVGFLVSQGAEQQQITTTTQVTVVGEGPGAQRITNTSTSVSRIAAQAEVPVPGQQSGPVAALLLKGLLVTPDERLNSITLIGDPRRVEIATALLTQLDLRRRQVAVNVKIIDINLLKTDNLSSSFSFGIGDSFFVFDRGAAVLNFGSGTPASLGQGLPDVTETPRRFLGLLQASITSGNAKILTDPTLVIQEGERSKVNLTSEVLAGFKTSFVSVAGDSVVPLQEPIIKEAGLILDIQVPRIDDNGFITLAIAPTISIPGNEVQSAGQSITLIQKRELSSGQIRVRDGQTLILTGVIQETDRTTVTKVPILGDIPLLGALFRRTNRINGRQEVVILLTPQILDDSNRASFGYNYNPSPDARRLLQRRGLPAPEKQ